jgi:hypothetical protein
MSIACFPLRSERTFDELHAYQKSKGYRCRLRTLNVANYNSSFYRERQGEKRVSAGFAIYNIYIKDTSAATCAVSSTVNRTVYIILYRGYTCSILLPRTHLPPRAASEDIRQAEPALMALPAPRALPVFPLRSERAFDELHAYQKSKCCKIYIRSPNTHSQIPQKQCPPGSQIPRGIVRRARLALAQRASVAAAVAVVGTGISAAGAAAFVTAQQTAAAVAQQEQEQERTAVAAAKPASAAASAATGVARQAAVSGAGKEQNQRQTVVYTTTHENLPLVKMRKTGLAYVVNGVLYRRSRCILCPMDKGGYNILPCKKTRKKIIVLR